MNEERRNGETILPISEGTLTAVARKNNKLQVALPDWLAQRRNRRPDLWGDCSASVFVPAPEQCSPVVITIVDPNQPAPQHEPNPEPARREVEILAGTLDFDSGSGKVRATAGQCVGASLADEATFNLSSDWADVGFVCK